jgi:hypothetical protein
MKSLPAFLSSRISALSATLLLAACLLPAHAAPVNSDRAAAVVCGWLKGDPKPLATALGGTVRRVESYPDATGAKAYHVVYLEPKGFVIVAADDRVEPIICFAPAGLFDPAENNPLGALVSRDMANRMAAARRSSSNRASSRAALDLAAKWQQLELVARTPSPQPNYLTSVSDVRVAPLTQTTWNQSAAGSEACYNYYTPPYTNGDANNYPCGCVATVMAQVMRYYQFPTTAIGNAGFFITNNGTAETFYLHGGNGSGGPYAWGNMPLSPSGSPTLAQCEAIGALTADAGATVNMSYAAGGSSSILLDAATALTGTFHYSSATQGWNDNADLGTNLVGMINPNLDAGSLVLLGISGSPGGHAVVADGYGYSSSTLYTHLNLGWGGASTAWYNLPTIDTANGGTFTIVDQCVYNVYTNGSGEIISGRILDQNSLPLPGVTVTATLAGGGAYTATTGTNGIYALTRLPSGSQYTVAISKTGYNSASWICSTGTSSDNAPASGDVWGVNASLSSAPTAVDHFSLSPIGSQGVGVPFSVTVSAFNRSNTPATSFVNTVNFTASGVTAVSNLIVGSLPSQLTDSYSSPYTFGYLFTPSTNLQVVAIRSYFGTKVSIWTGTGLLLASQNLSGQAGSWVETPLATPITLAGGSSYCVGVYCPASTTLYFTEYEGDWPTNFANGTIGQTCYISYGNAFPTGDYGDGLGPFLDLRYTTQEEASVPVSPASSGAFVNGVWTGNVSIDQIASNVVLSANDGAGHSGSSSSFNVGAYAPIRFSSPQRSGANQFQFTLTGGNKFQIQASTNLSNWITLATLTNSTGTTNYTDPATNLSRRFYRALQSQ